MNFAAFSRKDLQEMLDLIQLIIKCGTETELLKVIEKIKVLLCADCGVAGFGTAEDNKPHIKGLINEGYPAAWMSAYMSEGLFKKDPILLGELSMFRPLLWSELLKIFSREFYLDFMKTASDFRLNYGLATASRNNSGKVCVFSFASDKPRFKQRQKEILDVLSPHLFQALLRIWGKSEKFNGELTRREMEIIRWIKDGKTNWEVSVILKISERTAKFHIQNIIRKLDASNRYHAVAIALEHGILQ